MRNHMGVTELTKQKVQDIINELQKVGRRNLSDIEWEYGMNRGTIMRYASGILELQKVKKTVGQGWRYDIVYVHNSNEKYLNRG